MEFGFSAAKAPTDIDRHVGAQVRIRRIAVGMSQEQLARALQVSFQQLQKYENGTNRISAGRLAQVAEALCVPVESLFQEPLHRARDGAGSVGFSAFLNDPDGARMALAWAGIPPRIRTKLVALAEAAAAEAAK